MSEKLKINEVIIVEGKYDKIKLDSLLDAVIIETGGFKIFKDKEMKELIRRYASTCGIIILTDSDSAGIMIRNHLKSITDPGCRILNAYIPEISGKEKRKRLPGRQGLLGVEGVPNEAILAALHKCGFTQGAGKDVIDKKFLYSLGLSGGKNSAEKRVALCRALGLPSGLSAAALCDALTCFSSKEEIARIANEIV